jgi:hypothetical protein
MLRITKLHENARESMRRVIRYYQSGRLPTPDEILAAESEETPISDAPAPESVAPRRRRQVLALVVSGAVLAGVIAAASVSIYNRVFVIRSEFATITAPKLDVLAAATGRLIVDAPAAGQSVVRDQLLYTIQSPELDSELALLDAQIEAIKGVPAADVVKESNNSSVKFLSAGDTSEGVSARSNEAQLQLIIGQRKALELRREELSDFSACDCTVAWTAENGSWIKKGEPVAVLARTSNEAMRIEALVKLKNIDGLTPGATAYFRDPKSRKLEEAVVERVSLDPERQPRYGFPDWMRQDPTLGSVTLALNSPVSPEWIGLPIEVMFVRPIGLSRGGGSAIASVFGERDKSD